MTFRRLFSKRIVLRRVGSEGGAVLAEAALITPFVMLMIMSILWGALMFRTYLSANHAAENGARQASIAGTSSDVDWQILNEIRPSLNAINRKGISKIIVYPTSKYSDGPSTACLSSGTGCNVYTFGDLSKARPATASDWPGDLNFPPSSRVGGSANGLVGVYVELKPGANGLLLPAPKVLSSHKVAKIELS